MNTHQVLQSLIIPELLSIAKKAGIIENILCISLYGSANYGQYDKNTQDKKHSDTSDYDIWVVFKRNSSKETEIFASRVFMRDFNLPKDHSRHYILYDKLQQSTASGKFLIAPMVVTEESYGILNHHNVPTSNGTISIPWYRSRPRERPPKVPVCSADFRWLKFDMQQTHIIEKDIWELKMPVIVHKEKYIALGTFLECALSGDCFYGDSQKENELKRTLFLDSIRHLRLEETLSIDDNIALAMYQMMTLSKNAGSNFKERMVQQFSQWLYI